jgi:hypothetical protein
MVLSIFGGLQIGVNVLQISEARAFSVLSASFYILLSDKDIVFGSRSSALVLEIFCCVLPNLLYGW